MKASILFTASGVLVVCAAPAAGQALTDPAAIAPPSSVAAAAPVAIAPVAPSAGNAVLRTGTQVPLRLLHEITTQGKNLHVGDRVRMEVAEPVLVQGVPVIPAGSPAVGEITDVRNKGMWGKSGKFTARMLYLTVNGRQIRLSGGFDDKGVAGGVGAAAVSLVVIPVAGFFMTGTSARLPAGAIVPGFIDEDVPLAIQTATPAPLSVVAPAPLPTPAAPGAVSDAVALEPVSASDSAEDPASVEGDSTS